MIMNVLIQIIYTDSSQRLFNHFNAKHFISYKLQEICTIILKLVLRHFGFLLAELIKYVSNSLFHPKHFHLLIVLSIKFFIEFIFIVTAA